MTLRQHEEFQRSNLKRLILRLKFTSGMGFKQVRQLEQDLVMLSSDEVNQERVNRTISFLNSVLDLPLLSERDEEED